MKIIDAGIAHVNFLGWPRPLFNLDFTTKSKMKISQECMIESFFEGGEN